MTVAERVMCRCGLGMSSTRNGTRYCENCDTVQPQEPHGLPRTITRNDVRFDASWLIVMNTEYVDNTNKGETPDEPEDRTETND